MVDLSIKDAHATGGGCGCGGHGHENGQAGHGAGGCACGCGGHGQAAAAEQGPASVDGANVAQYQVSGMTCSHCVAAVTEEVSALPGVTDVHVDLESGSMKVASDAPVDFDRIVEAVSEAGDYTVA